jgi:type I restriction enzyme M protein
MPDHNYFANLIWQIADLLRGPYRPPQYERVMLPMTVLRRFDCVLAPTKAKVLAEYDKRKGGKLNDDALDRLLNKASGQRFHNHSKLDFEKLKGDPDNIERHIVGYIKGFSANVQRIFEYFEFENEIAWQGRVSQGSANMKTAIHNSQPGTFLEERRIFRASNPDRPKQ